MLALGRWRLAALVDATYALDGGAMFGVVPRPLWERQLAPDGRNRVRLAARCLLAVDGAAGRRVLVDTGLGGGRDPAQRDLYAIEDAAGGLTAALARHGLGPLDVTDVVLTQLRFDQAGGLVRRGQGGRPALAFPRATHHVQRRQWAWAHSPPDRDAAGYLPEALSVLDHSGQLHLLDGEGELAPDLEVIVAEGPTVAGQLPRFHGGGSHLTCCAGVVPTRAHLRAHWVTAYDQHPLTTIEEKKVLLAQALEDDGILFLQHDLEVAACRLREEEGHPAFREPVAL